MSIRRIIAIIIIFLISCVSWWILGTATSVRSNNYFSRLTRSVQNLWGTPLSQKAPELAVEIPGSNRNRPVIPSSNSIQVHIEKDYRQKGLIWYPTYRAKFKGTYTITNTDPVTQKIFMHFLFPVPEATYDNFEYAVNGKAVMMPVDTQEGLRDIYELAPGESQQFSLQYQTRGINFWNYIPAANAGRIQNLDMKVSTDFTQVDYTEGSLSPMQAEKTHSGMQLHWTASDLITQAHMGIVIPEKLNPGPLTSRITFFAPVCLLFFFVLIATINIIYKLPVHPMHYLFVAAGFFAFHLLLSYMVCHFGLHLSFLISTVTSVTMVTMYLSAALGKKFPWKIAVAGQLFYLVLFSYSFFIKGYTGLTVAIGSVITLGVLMRVTAQLDWNNLFIARTRKQGSVPDHLYRKGSEA